MATKRIIAALVGQSNELGAGVNKSTTGAFGGPLKDPITPNGSGRSMWPYLSEMMGKRGIWLTVHNSAVGATSVTTSWCGKSYAWSSGMLVAVGMYVSYGGALFKCTYAGVNTVQASTTAPAVGTGADTNTWAAVAGSPDAAGTMYSDGQARFDPNGYMAAAYAGLSSAVGYDEKWVFVSLGQGDKTLSTSRSDYAQGLRNTVNYFLARGIKVALGFTCSGNSSGLEAWYQSDLLPGYADALATYSGNSNVFAGANLRASLGILPTTPASGPGVQADTLHMNDDAYLLASEAWRDALVAAGW